MKSKSMFILSLASPRWLVQALLLIGAIAMVGLTDAQPVASEQKPPIASSNRVSKEEQEKIFVQRSGRTIRGKVVDGYTGLPLTKFRINLGLKVNGALVFPNAYVQTTKDISNPDGSFSMEFDPKQNNDMDANTIEASADGYSNGTKMLSDPKDGVVEVLLKLRRAGPLMGFVVTPDGKIASGTDVMVMDAGTSGNGPGPDILGPGRLFDRDLKQPVHTTGAGGTFTFRSPPESGRLVAVSKMGFASVSIAEVWAAGGRVALQPYGRIEGFLQVPGAPVGRQELTLSIQAEGISAASHSYKVTTDENGHFVFTMVPPGQATIIRWIPVPWKTSRSISPGKDAGLQAQNRFESPLMTPRSLTELTVESGQTNRLTLRVTDAVLNGQVRFESPLPSDVEFTTFASISPLPPQVPAGLSYEEIRTYTQSPEWRMRSKRRAPVEVPVEDGRFVFNAISPGEYRLSVEAVRGGQDPWFLHRGDSVKLAKGEATITVPTNSTPASPIKLDEIVLKTVETKQSR